MSFDTQPQEDRPPAMDRDELIARANAWKGKAVVMNTVNGDSIPGISHGQAYMDPYITVEERASENTTRFHSVSASSVADFIKLQPDE